MDSVQRVFYEFLGLVQLEINCVLVFIGIRVYKSKFELVFTV